MTPSGAVKATVDKDVLDKYFLDLTQKLQGEKLFQLHSENIFNDTHYFQSHVSKEMLPLLTAPVTLGRGVVGEDTVVRVIIRNNELNFELKQGGKLTDLALRLMAEYGLLSGNQVSSIPEGETMTYFLAYKR